MPIIQRPSSSPNEKLKLSQEQIVRDTRSVFKKFQDLASEDKAPVLFIFVILTILGTVFPAFSLIVLVLMSVLFMMIYVPMSTSRLPMRLPVFAKTPDYSDPIPGSRLPNEASGVILIGNESGTNKELWVSVRDATTHFMVFGSTGAGKTELLMGLGTTSLLMGSGFSLTDPKGSQKVAIQVYSLCRFFLREHDFRLLNYSSVASGWSGRTHQKETNTTNPFYRGTDVDAANTLTSLITVSKGDNAVFGAQAQNFMTALLRGLVELRDRHRRPLDVRTIRDHTPSAKFIELSNSPMLSKNTKDSMKSFLSSVGYSDKVEPSKQNSFNQQYGYALAYFSQPLNSLTDSYGYIYGAIRGEVDRIDCIRERRILVEIIPSMKKSPAEVSNIGKISLSATKMAVGVGLGDRLEGVGQEVLSSTPMSGRESSPYTVIIDEMAAIATEGFVTVLTQGRSIGVAAVIASQDADGLKKASEGEYNQATENTKIKLFGTMDLAGGTFKLLEEATGKIMMSKTQGSEIRTDSIAAGSYYDGGRVASEEMARVKIGDLQGQIEGEFHMVFRGSLIRGKGFYANPDIKGIKMRLNRFITNPNVYEEDISEFKKDVGMALVDLLNPPKNGYMSPRDSMSKAFTILGNILSDAGTKRTGLGVREQAAGAFEIWKDISDKIGSTGSAGGRGNSQKLNKRPVDAKPPRSKDDVETKYIDKMVEEQRRIATERFGVSSKESLMSDMDAIHDVVDSMDVDADEFRDIARTVLESEDYDPKPDPKPLSEGRKSSLQDRLRSRLKNKGMADN